MKEFDEIEIEQKLKIELERMEKVTNKLEEYNSLQEKLVDLEESLKTIQDEILVINKSKFSSEIVTKITSDLNDSISKLEEKVQKLDNQFSEFKELSNMRLQNELDKIKNDIQSVFEYIHDFENKLPNINKDQLEFLIQETNNLANLFTELKLSFNWGDFKDTTDLKIKVINEKIDNVSGILNAQNGNLKLYKRNNFILLFGIILLFTSLLVFILK